MRFFRYKRDKAIGAYNFGQFQIYVCTLINTKGKISKGMTVLSSDTVIEIPFPLTEDEAMVLSNYFTSVGNGDLPKAYKLKGGWFNYFISTYFKFTKIEEGMLKGRISLGQIVGGRTAWVTVNPKTVFACTQAINTLYRAG